MFTKIQCLELLVIIIAHPCFIDNHDQMSTAASMRLWQPMTEPLFICFLFFFCPMSEIHFHLSTSCPASKQSRRCFFFPPKISIGKISFTNCRILATIQGKIKPNLNYTLGRVKNIVIAGCLVLVTKYRLYQIS